MLKPPLLHVYVFRTLKLLNVPPHLRPIKLKKSGDAVDAAKTSDSPFIYSPLQIFKTKTKDASEIGSS
jgi:hypothetical protein